MHIFHKDNITWVLECSELFSYSLDTLRAVWLAVLFYIDKYFFLFIKDNSYCNLAWYVILEKSVAHLILLPLYCLCFCLDILKKFFLFV